MTSLEHLAIPLVGLALLVVVWLLARRTSSRLADSEAWRPTHLREATVVFAEKDFFTEQPDRIVARVDRVYRTKDQEHYVTELKRRNYASAFTSDQIELSAQAVALARSQGVLVSSTGYVITENALGRRQALPVPLLSERAVGELATRFRQLIAGKINPVRANRVPICSKCAFKDRCRPPALYSEHR